MPLPLAKVYLVGAGPGDPGLLTLRGRECLARADVVLYDYLVNQRILQHLRPEAERVCLGRHGEGRLVSQDEIHRRIIEAAQAGRTVVRLKGGDPAIFGRTFEEIAALEAAGVPYEVVPGVTAAQAASSYTGIPLTHRDEASCVAFVTGQEGRGKEGPSLDMAGLASFPGTLVFYMGVTTAPTWVGELMAHGKPPETPAGIVRHASLPQQQTIVTTLGDLPAVLAASRIRPPAVIIVGEAVGARAKLDWFTARPLFGKTVMVTRPAHQADPLAGRLAELGAAVIMQPAIDIGPPADWRPFDDAIERLSQFDWLVFSSANGVDYFLDRLSHLGLDLRALGSVKLAAIGPATSDALRERGLRADAQPAEYRAEALAETLLPAAREGQRMLLLRASRGRGVLAETLGAAGASVEQIVVYASRDVTSAQPEVAGALRAGRIDWITVTSSAIARALTRMFGADLARANLAAISPLTAGVLQEAGFEAAVVASPYTTAGLLDAIVDAETSS